MNHAKINDDITQLAQLKDQKGRLSRLIGKAKKNQQDCTDLIDEMQRVTAQIKELQTTQAPRIKPERESEKRFTIKPGPFEGTINSPDNVLNNRIISLDNTSKDEQWHQKWNDYVSTNRRCSVYHRIEFKTIIQNTFQQTPHYLLALDDKDNIAGIFPSLQLKSRLFGNFIISMPYFKYGGPIADNANTEQQLILALINKARQIGVEHIKLRETQPREDFPTRTDKAALLLALPDSEKKLWEQIGSKIRAQIKKAQSHGLKIRIGQKELLNDFYQVFSENIRDLGTPVYSRDFFETLLDNLQESSTELPHPKSQLAIAYNSAGKAVSAGFLICHKDTVEIPWASTLRSANKLNANMFLYWHILENSVKQRFAFFDFGRSSKEAGTFKFKKQWGAKPQQFFWHYWLPDNTPLPAIITNNPKFTLAIKIWQHLPVWLTKFLGPSIVKNIP